MEILLWLVPPAVVTLVAMAWVSWLGREGRGEVDREEAVRRMGKALAGDHPGARYARPAVPRDRSTGVAVRPSARRPQPPRRLPQPGRRPSRPSPQTGPSQQPGEERTTRRAS